MSFDDSNSQNTVTSLRGRLIDSDTSADELAPDYPSTMFRIKRQKKEQTRPGTPRSMRGEPRSMRIRHRNISFHQKRSVKLLSRNTSLAALATTNSENLPDSDLPIRK